MTDGTGDKMIDRAKRFGVASAELEHEKKAERAKRFESTQKGDTDMVETTKEVAAQEVTESHNEVHESVAEEKVAKRRTNSKPTMLSVKILKMVDWTQTVSIQKSESLPDSVVWNIGCV